MFSANRELAAAVRARVVDALGPHAFEDEEHLSVDVRDGCAILHGHVRTWMEHEALERAALATPGVARVDNRLCLFVKAKPTEPRAERRA